MRCSMAMRAIEDEQGLVSYLETMHGLAFAGVWFRSQYPTSYGGITCNNRGDRWTFLLVYAVLSIALFLQTV